MITLPPSAQKITPTFREASAQRSLRDSDSVPRMWSKLSAIAFNVSELLKAVESQGQQITRIKRRIIGGVSASKTSSAFRVVAVYGDYLKCQIWSSGSLSGQDVLVAKPFNMRRSIEAENVDGVSLTYDWTTDTDSSGNTRVANDGTNTESQVCYPRYIYHTQAGNVAANNQDFIVASMSQSETGVAQVDATGEFWIEVSPSRVWAKKYA